MADSRAYARALYALFDENRGPQRVAAEPKRPYHYKPSLPGTDDYRLMWETWLHRHGGDPAVALGAILDRLGEVA